MESERGRLEGSWDCRFGVDDFGAGKGLGMIGIVSWERGVMWRFTGLTMRESWSESARSDWKLDRELPVSYFSKSAMSAEIGR